MTNDPRAKQLKDEANFNPVRAHAYVTYDGKCAFCGCDLIDTPEHYALGTIDHLLPKGEYPELADLEVNHVLSCFTCNQLKDGYHGLQKGEDPEKTLHEGREELLRRARAHLDQKRPRWETEWSTARRILRGDRPENDGPVARDR